MISRSMAVLVWFLAILVYGRFGPTPPPEIKLHYGSPPKSPAVPNY